MKGVSAYAPTHEEIVKFAKDISGDYSLFPLVSQSELNRQVLMNVNWSSDEKDVAIDFENEL